MTKEQLEYKALNILEKQPNLTQRQLAVKLNISLGKTHYLIKSLIAIGWVKLENFQRSDNKWGYAYLLTPKGVVEKSKITISFLEKKEQEYIHLQKEIAQLRKEVQKIHNKK